jgi:hypothetical protein
MGRRISVGWTYIIDANTINYRVSGDDGIADNEIAIRITVTDVM